MNRPSNSDNSKTNAPRCFHLAVLAAFLCCATSAVAQVAPANANKTAAPTRHIVVSFPDRKLALTEGDRILRIYDVAVGATDSPSPAGEFHIVRRLENPTYYHPGVVIGPGANNPLGPRWIGLDIKGFGIHGTNRPDSIGKHASHGCIRLRNSDIKDLFARVQVGDSVSLIAERTDETARLFGAAPATADAAEILQARNQPSSHTEPVLEDFGSR